jgi:hypothetical protein
MKSLRSRLPLLVGLSIAGATVAGFCGWSADLEDASDPAVMTYGFAPKPTGAIRLQPDVVIVKGGARAIRSVREDDLVWTIDASAPGASDLAVGRVMFLTSRAVGRVLGLDRRGANLELTLGPVSITEIVRDGTLRLEQELTDDSVRYQEVPRLASVLFPVLRAASPPPDAGKSAVQRSILGFDVEAFVKKGVKSKSANGTGDEMSLTAVGLTVSRNMKQKFGVPGGNSPASGGLKFGGEAIMHGQQIKVHMTLPIADGQVGGGATLLITGVERITFGIAGGAENGISDNVKARFDVPIEGIVQFPPSPWTGGLPTVVQVKFKAGVETFFSSRTSTLTAGAEYAVSGPIGVENGVAVTPDLKVIQSLRDGISGISIGAVGLVFNAEVRVLGGLGTKAFATGLYGKVQIAAGVSRGSVLGVPLAMCTGITEKFAAGAGLGLLVLEGLEDKLTKLMANVIQEQMTEALRQKIKEKLKADLEVTEWMHTFRDKTSVLPNVPLCGGGGGGKEGL